MNSLEDLYNQFLNINNHFKKITGSDENYILIFIFFKYLSENLEDEIKNKEIKKNDLKTEKQRIKDIVVGDIGYYFNPDLTFSKLITNIKNNNKENLISDIQKAFKEIEDSTINKDSNHNFLGLFSDIDLSGIKLGRDDKEKRNVLSKILSEINEIDWELNRDILGDAYESLIFKFALSAGKKGGEFYTPSEVSLTIAKLAATNTEIPKSIYDPTCGSGSLLIKVYHELNKKLDEFDLLNIYGQEKYNTPYNLARMNMFLHKIDYDNFKILKGDTISNDKFPNKKFDIIVANPPLGLSWEPNDNYLHSDERFSKYGILAPKSNSEIAFLQHMLWHLSRSGLMLTVLSPGFLFRVKSELKMRKYIIEQENQLDAIIQLPKNLFFKVNMFLNIGIFKKCRKENEKILFIDASKGFEKIKNQNKLREKDINDIVNVYQNKLEIDKKNLDYDLISRNISLEEIKKKDFNLSINRYIDPTEEIFYRSLDEIKFDLENLKKEQEELEKIISEQEKEIIKNYL